MYGVLCRMYIYAHMNTLPRDPRKGSWIPRVTDHVSDGTPPQILWKSSTCSLPLSQPSQSVVSHFSIILLTYTHPEYFKAKATFNSCNILFLFYVYVLFVYTLYSQQHVYTFVYYICIHKLHIAL